jgi:hypothetical protein
MAALSSDMAFSSSSQNGEEPESSSQQETISSQEETRSCEVEAEIPLPNAAEERVNVAKEEAVFGVESRPTFLPPLLKRQSSSATSLNESSSLPSTGNVFKSFSSTPGYLANRWNSVNSSFSTPASSSQHTFRTPPL